MISPHAFIAGFRTQLLTVLVEPVDFLLTVVVFPVGYSAVFLLLIQHAGRLAQLAIYGILGPALLSVWANAVTASGELIQDDRSGGTLELLVATPAGSFELSLLGRIAANTLLSLTSLLETLIVSKLGFGVTLHISSVPLFAGGLVVLLFTTGTAALMMSNIFILLANVRIFQNALTFPFYLLAGIAFPLSVLPFWLRPFSALVGLSWSSDLLRASTGSNYFYSPVTSMTMGVVVGTAYLAVGHRLFLWTERRVRRDATLGSY